MAAKSQERLPAGSAVQFKVQKNGRKIELLAKEKDLDSENSNINLVAEENNQPEWLPDGWVVNLKTRMSGSAIGKQYKVYIDPSTGCKFFSKPEVLRHLESIKHKNFVCERKTIRSSTSSASKVVADKSTVIDLPPGWIKQTKSRKTARGVRKDPYYTDPVTGYVFRSKKDVFRYLETGEMSKYAFKPAKGGIDDPESINEGALPLPDAKRQKLDHPAARRRLFPGKESSDVCSPTLPEYEILKEGRGKGVSAETGLAGAPKSEIFPGQMAKMTIGKGAETKANSSLGSLELAKLKGSQRNQGKSSFADNGSVSTLAIDSLQGQRLLESQINCSHRKSKQELNLPCRSSKRLAGLEPELVVNWEPIERAPKNVTTESCKSKAIPAAGLTSSGFVDEVSWQLEAGSVMEQRVPLFFGDSYIDPCLQSAFKALLSETPGTSNPDSGHVSTPVADILQENNLQTTKLEKRSSRKTLINLMQSKNKQELHLPRRSSHCLAGLEPEMVANSLSIERVPRKLTTESCENKAIQSGGLNFSVLVAETSELLKAILGEQSAKTNDGESEPLISSSSGNSYLDPCKALMGEKMVDCVPDIGHVSITEADVLLGNLKQSKLGKSSNKKSRINRINRVKSKTKQELSLSRRSSKRLAGLGPDLVANSFSSEQASGNATIESCKSEVLVHAVIDPHDLLDSTPLRFEAGHETTLAQHDFTDVGAQLHEESPNKSSKPLESQTVSGEQSQNLESERLEAEPEKLENERTDNENPDSHILFPFGDSWSDPCLEFAFKTLTGAIPVEDNLAIQDYFQHQLDPSNTQKDGSSVLPDFGSIDYCQTNISFQLDAPENQPASQQQFPANPSPPAENVSFPSCSTIASEQHCIEGNKKFDGKVKS